VLGEDGLPVEPAEAYLAYLAALEKSPNTLRAHAHSLRMWLEFLAGQRVGSHFDLTGIAQRWLRDLLWDYLAGLLRSRAARAPAAPSTPSAAPRPNWARSWPPTRPAAATIPRS
jgi:hypothetical protein